MVDKINFLPLSYNLPLIETWAILLVFVLVRKRERGEKKKTEIWDKL